MSNQSGVHSVVNGPTKAMLSEALFNGQQSETGVQFVYEKEASKAVSGVSLWQTGSQQTQAKKMKIVKEFHILSVEREDGSGESFNIRARHETHGRVKIYFRTDRREGFIEFLEIE